MDRTTTPNDPTDLSRTTPHRDRNGRFRNPWPGASPHGLSDLFKWVWQRRGTRSNNSNRSGRSSSEAARAAPDVDGGVGAGVRVGVDVRDLTTVAPAFPTPRADTNDIVITWVGHSSFLIQIGGANILLDPIWSERASPVQFAGPRRFVAPAVNFDSLPPIDFVIISHDHYDHLDRDTVRLLTTGHPQARWIAPLVVGSWLRDRGANVLAELDWWQSVHTRQRHPPAKERHPRAGGGGDPCVTGAGLNMDPRIREDDGAALNMDPRVRDDDIDITCTPAQHFSGRRPDNRDSSLWCGWVIRAGARAVFFAGDTGLHPEFGSITRQLGPFDVALLPIGAYDPRWFMHPVHMAPEESVAAYVAIAAANSGQPVHFIATHWGTFKLTDEPLTEPRELTRQSWRAAGLDEAMLCILKHGETVRLNRG